MPFPHILIASAELSAETPEFLTNSFLSWLTNSILVTALVLGGIVWSSFLVAMGYFYGYLWREIKQYIEWVGWIIFAVAIISIITITIYKNTQAKKLLKDDSEGK